MTGMEGLVVQTCEHGKPGYCPECHAMVATHLAKMARDQPKPKCGHKEFHFDRGGFHVVCSNPECGRRWGGLDLGNNIMPDFMMMGEGLSSSDRRVDPFYVPPLSSKN